MRFIWTEDTGAGLHYWELVNHYLLNDSFCVESKMSNQGLLDAVRNICVYSSDEYFIAFDIVYDNMDVMNKYLELSDIASSSEGKIKILDVTCFEYIIFAFKHLIDWTETGRKDKIVIRENILAAFEEHSINTEKINDDKTMNYLMGFKRYSTERVLKSIVSELTDSKLWSVKGEKMGECWYKDCCVISSDVEKCTVSDLSGENKIMTLLQDNETQRILKTIFTEKDY